jgi:RNA polymerase sigma-70 factor (ECF subfamily)
MKVMDNIDREEAAIGFIDGIPPQGDMILVAAAKNGNKNAFEMLVKRHQRRIFCVARRITRTREDAEDIVQQSFQKAFSHLRNFEERSAFSSWLTRIAINEGLMFARRIRGHREVSIDDADGNEETTTALEVPDSSPDPEAIYSQRESMEMLSEAMKELSPGIPRAIQLRELDERSSEETARILGISITVEEPDVSRKKEIAREIEKHRGTSLAIRTENFTEDR